MSVRSTIDQVDRVSTGLSSRTGGPLVWAIARLEGTRLVRNPLFLAGVLAAFALLLVQTTGDAPVLHRDDVYAGSSLYPLAAITLLLANGAALRRQRSATDDLEEAAPASLRQITAAMVVAVGWAVAAAVVVVALEFGMLRAIGGIWAPSALEGLVGPAIVGVCGILGVVLARWLPSRLTAPVAIVALVALEIWLSSPGHDTDARAWFAMWPPKSWQARELVFRPVGWHLIYLAGIAGLVGVLALWRHGWRPSYVPAVGLTITAMLGGGAGQVGSSAVGEKAVAYRERVLASESVVCRSLRKFDYCAYPAYTGWIPRWARAVEGVKARMPGEPIATVNGLRQTYRQAAYFDDTRAGTLVVVTEWGRWSREGEYELAVALSIAQRAVGLPGNDGVGIEHRVTKREARQIRASYGSARPYVRLPKPGEVVVHRVNCKAAAQARTVTAMWLAARATPEAEAALRRQHAAHPYGFYPDPDGEGLQYDGPLAYWFDGAPFGPHPVIPANADVARAVQMLDAGERIEPLVRRYWKEITAFKMSRERLAKLLGLPVLPTLAEQVSALGGEPKTTLLRRVYGPFIKPDGTERLPADEGPQLSCP